MFSYNFPVTFQSDFDKRLSIIFQILVMTLPSMYSVAYLTFWQNKVTSLVMSKLFMVHLVKQWFLTISPWRTTEII